jgi:hypothetical protein
MQPKTPIWAMQQAGLQEKHNQISCYSTSLIDSSFGEDNWARLLANSQESSWKI